MARHGNRGASRKRNGTETRIGTEPIYGDMIAVIYSMPDGRLRVAVEEMGVERQSWPIERSAHAVQELAARIRGIRETLIAKHGPDLGPRNPLLFREGEVVEAPSSHGELARREAMLPTYAPRRRRKVLSYGGGIDSFAMLVDAVQRGEKPDLVVFADVTDRNREDPGEWPETYSHIERVAIPYCNQHGIPFVWLHTDQSPVRGHRSLYAYLRSLNAMVGRTSRMCTVASKVERVAAFLAAEFPRETVEVWIGFEAGEEDRAEKDPHAVGSSAKRASKASLRVSRFPMIERRICRCRAVELIRAAGLEVPPGSACVYCLAGETPVVTRAGIRPIRDLAGSSHDLLVPQVGTRGGLQHRGSFHNVEVRSFGVQPLWEVSLRRGRSLKVVRATAEHRWFLAADRKGGSAEDYERTTETLVVGDNLRTLRATPPAREDRMSVAVAQGFTFGDGSRPATDLRPAEVTLYGTKDLAALPFFAGHPAAHVNVNGAPSLRVYGLPRFWKDLPPLNESRSFLLSWLAGYFAADGSVAKDGQVTIESASLDALRFVCSVAAVCGVGYSLPRSRLRQGFGVERTAMHRVTLRGSDLPDWFFIVPEHARRAASAADRRGTPADLMWKVESVRPLGIEEEVFCAVVPGAQAFGIAEDLMTGNCPFSSRGDFQRLDEKHPTQFVSVRTLESSAKKTKSGETIRFSGGSEDPALVDWIAGTYKPRHKPCAVCGAAQRTRKNVGCSPSEMDLVR